MALSDSEKREILEDRIRALEVDRFGHEVNSDNLDAIAVIDAALVKAREALASLA